MAIYLDAEVLYGLSPNSLALSSLRIIAREHRLDLAIPEVALNEATAKRRDQIETKASAILSAIDKAKGFFDLPHFRVPDSKRLVAAWRHDLLGGMKLIPAVPEHAAEALDRELNRIAPAREGQGARDAAIWLAIRDDHLSRSEPGYFISGNHRHFGEPPDGHLHSQLRAELTGGQAFTYVHEISALLPILAEVGGRPFTIAELSASVGLKWMVRNRLNDQAAQHDNLNMLVELAFGAPLRWSSISTSVKEPTLWKIPHQTVYHLSTGQEVAVLRTSWAAFVEVRLTGPRQLVEAGFREGLGALTAEIELWARREPQAPEADFAISGADKIEIAISASAALPPVDEAAGL
jgi:hypothetical protein